MNFWDRYEAGMQIEAFVRAFKIGMDGLHMLGEGTKQIAAMRERQMGDQRKGTENPCEAIRMQPSDPTPGIYRHYKGKE